MELFKNNRLAFRLAKVSVLIAFILGLLLSSIQVYLDYREQGKALDEMIEKILSVAERPASTAVHLLSKDLAGEVVTGLLEYNFIERAVITDDLKLLLAEKNRNITTDKTLGKLAEYFSDEHKQYSIDLTAPSVSTETPGKLTVVVNVNVVLSSFYDRAVIIFSGGIVRNILLTFLLFFSFFYIITNPLSVLSREFSKRKPWSPGANIIDLPAGHQNDEFSTLVASINQFLSASRTHIDELNNNNQALKAAKKVSEISESKFKNLYQGSDISIWEEDFSLLVKELEKLKLRGIKDIKSYLLQNPSHLIEMSTMVKVIGVNEATIDMFEAPSSEEFIKNVSEVFDPDTSLSVFAEEVEAIWNGDSYFRREVKQRTLKGNLLSTILSLPIPKTFPEFSRIPVTLVDTTQLRMAQEQIRKLSLAIQHNPSAVFITDLAGIIEYANPKVTTITGYDTDNLLGTNISNLRLTDHNSVSTQEIWNRLIVGEEWRSEVSAKKQNGETIWAREFIAPIKDEHDQVTHFVAMYEDISEEKRIFDEISFRATHDILTKLINRDEFERRLERVVLTAQQEDSMHVLCFMDLDQFKVVNDTSGHIAGDELLKQLSKLLLSQIRKRDTVARIGGDEFAILLEHCELPQALNSMENVRQAVEEFQFKWEENVYRMTASIGVAIINKNTVNTTEILKQADLACYVSKERGRNHVHVYDTSNQQISLREGEMHLVAKISKALEENQFRLFVQPIIPLRDSDAGDCYEVLIRMQESQGQIIPPGQFLPSAERYGLSSAIDKWVINNVFDWVASNLTRLPEIQHFAINLSGRSLGDASVLKCIADQFHSRNIPAELFSFEITETAAIGNLPEAVRFINAIKDYGCTVALDDFGSGLSSFAYLKNLSVDYLKIDGMFVKEIINDPIDEAMVKSINDIGHVMGIQTIAEFVENKSIQDKLMKIGVDYGQGYGISKPVAIDEILTASNT